MNGVDPRDAIILSLADKLYICSRLLTAAAERCVWDSKEVRTLLTQLDRSIEDSKHAGIKASTEDKHG